MKVNIHTDTSVIQSKKQCEILLAGLHELRPDSVRFAIRPRRFLDTDGNVDKRFFNNIHSFIASLPSCTKPLAYVYGLSSNDMMTFFEGSDTFRARWSKLIQIVAEEFRGTIKDWEIWNEPNVSWSYLSRKSQDSLGHRPWTAKEFVDDILVPASTVLKSIDQSNQIIVGAIAEDGIRGHHNKQPSFSRQFPPTSQVLQAFLKTGEQDAFYIIPDFIKSLAPELAGKREYFDAIAQHPYPYFQGNSSTELFQNSVIKLQAMRKELNSAGLDDVPLTITETGARELDFFNRHEFLPNNQTDYLQSLLENLQSNSDFLNVNRLYWYQWSDRHRDMLMEKPFGIINVDRQPKPIYHDILFNNISEEKFRCVSISETSQREQLGRLLATFNPDRDRFSFFLPVSNGTIVTLGRNLSERLSLTPRNTTPLTRFELQILQAGEPDFLLALVDASEHDLAVIKINDQSLEVKSKTRTATEQLSQKAWGKMSLIFSDNSLQLSLGTKTFDALQLDCGGKPCRVELGNSNKRSSAKITKLQFSYD